MTNAKNKPSYKLIELQNAVPHAADLASEVYQTYEPDQNAISQAFISLSLGVHLKCTPSMLCPLLSSNEKKSLKRTELAGQTCTMFTE